MSTDWPDVIAKALPAVATVLTVAYTTRRGPGVLRDRLKIDTEILDKIPESSPARKRMLGIVQAEVKDLDRYHKGRRDLPSLIGAIFGSLGMWYFTVWLLRHDGWWTIPAAIVSGFLAIVFTYGMIESGQRKARDGEDGRVS